MMKIKEYDVGAHEYGMVVFITNKILTGCDT